MIDEVAGYVTTPLLSVMGCIEQYQICNPNLAATSMCTELSRLEQVKNQSSTHDLGFNPHQVHLAQHLIKLLSLSTLDGIISSMGSSALVAMKYESSSTSISSPLPDNQWKIEVTNWHHMMQTALQQHVIDFAAGPADPHWGQYILKPSFTGAGHDLCSAQKMRDTSFMSFSILGLTIIFIIGGLLIALPPLLPILTRWAQQLGKKGFHRPDYWLLADAIHLQQMAFEGAGLGTWQGRNNTMPVTVQGEKFRLPQFEDPTDSDVKLYAALNTSTLSQA